MAVHIRHGAPGSFKTAAAVWIDILGWLREGRVVYTNIRGMLDVPDIEIVLKETFPDGANLIVVDTDSQEDRTRFAAWFHWLPIGAAICIDEGQFIYPSRRDFKPESLDYPGGLNAATEANRPPDIYTAIDKHRHYNWDVSVTTPNIKKLPEWLRGVVEAAYHHKSMEHLPLFGKRKARIHKHDPSTTGVTVNKQSQYHFQRIPVAVHSLYGSTISGEITRNRAEQNPLKNPRLIGLFVLAGFSAIVSLSLFFGGDSEADPVVSQAGSAASGVVSHPRDDRQGVASRVDRLALPDPSAWSVFADFMPGAQGISVAGWYRVEDHTNYLYRIVTDAASFVVPERWLSDAGFALQALSDCSHDLTHPMASGTLRVLCSPIRDGTSEPSEDVTNGGMGLSSVMPLSFGS